MVLEIDAETLSDRLEIGAKDVEVESHDPTRGLRRFSVNPTGICQEPQAKVVAFNELEVSENR